MKKPIIHIDTPQFERTEKRSNDFVPATQEEFYKTIESATITELSAMGFALWEPNEEMTLLLFPGEWYTAIPHDFVVYDISGEKEFFKKGESDDDIRFGCLPYGIIRKF